MGNYKWLVCPRLVRLSVFTIHQFDLLASAHGYSQLFVHLIDDHICLLYSDMPAHLHITALISISSIHSDDCGATQSRSLWTNVCLANDCQCWVTAGYNLHLDSHTLLMGQDLSIGALNCEPDPLYEPTQFSIYDIDPWVPDFVIEPVVELTHQPWFPASIVEKVKAATFTAKPIQLHACALAVFASIIGPFGEATQPGLSGFSSAFNADDLESLI
eukprot:scaffold140182_cov46-Prasinocladus_malaysianus.AAC.1